ncbi:MAG: AI-2E family transporter [Pseudomonadota bacterium]
MNARLNKKKLIAIAGILVLLGLFLYGLNAILMPFIVAALLAYLGDPLVDRLELLSIQRSIAVAIVFLLLTSMLVIGIVLLGPLLSDQLHQLAQKMPIWFERMESFLLPILRDWGFMHEGEGNQTMWKEAITNYLPEGGNIVLMVIKKVSSSGAALLGAITNTILVPVLTFYLLRDWDIIVEKLRNMVPFSSRHTVVQVSKECDEVLSSFFRGQFIVMLSLALFYSVCLGVMGIELALLIGTIAGLANIIPYMGFVVGIVSALIAAWMQFHAIPPLMYVAIIFAVGQLLEGMLLTPLLVGDKIGLHPVSVIFALMAGAQLGGFFGLLIALPVAAILMVLVRYFIKQYKLSALYGNESDCKGYVQSQEGSLDHDVSHHTVAEIQMDVPIIASSQPNYEEDSVFDDSIWFKGVSAPPLNDKKRIM